MLIATIIGLLCLCLYLWYVIERQRSIIRLEMSINNDLVFKLRWRDVTITDLQVKLNRTHRKWEILHLENYKLQHQLKG